LEIDGLEGGWRARHLACSEWLTEKLVVINDRRRQLPVPASIDQSTQLGPHAHRDLNSRDHNRCITCIYALS